MRKFYKKQVYTKQERFTPANGWNEQFLNVFDFVTNDSGNGAIEAVAGGGKTTALVESIIRWSEVNPRKTAVFIAFNVSVKEEAAKRLAGYPVDVITCHGLGFKAITNYYKEKFDVQGSTGEYMQKLAQNEFGYEQESFDDRCALLELVSKAKASLSSTDEELHKIVTDFGIEFVHVSKDKLVSTAKKLLHYTQYNFGSNFGKKIITFDDQIWLTIVNKLDVPQYDAVFVDEAQDLSKARQTLVKLAMKKDSRIFLVGDKFQAIYQFSMADSNSLGNMIEQHNCTRLPLSVTWRCGNKIVESAQKFNPDIIAAPNAIDGEINSIEENSLIDEIKYGDVLLSRTNAPLVRWFFKLAKINKKAKILGKDYGSMLAMRIKKWESEHTKNGYSFSANDILEYNEGWYSAISEKSKKPSTRQKDEYETIKVMVELISSDLDSSQSVKDVLNICYSFSSDESKGLPDKDCVVLSTIHKFKGCERDRVFVIKKTLSEESEEEKNLCYVAITRAKKNLVWIEKGE
jgi:superfamily I DNA/RNA helicase